MIIKAEIENNVVVNIIVVDPDDIPDWCADWPTMTRGGIGWGWDGRNFIEPAPLPFKPSAPINDSQ